LLAEIEYRAISAEGKVRHPFFKGLLEDLSSVGASPLDLDAAALSPPANASTCNGDPEPKRHIAFNVAGIFICSQAHYRDCSP
jgi:hypothetical protein